MTTTPTIFWIAYSQIPSISLPLPLPLLLPPSLSSLSCSRAIQSCNSAWRGPLNLPHQEWIARDMGLTGRLQRARAKEKQKRERTKEGREGAWRWNQTLTALFPSRHNADSRSWTGFAAPLVQEKRKSALIMFYGSRQYACFLGIGYRKSPPLQGKGPRVGPQKIQRIDCTYIQKKKSMFLFALS